MKNEWTNTMKTLHTCKNGTGFCSLSPIRVRQSEEFIYVVRFEKASLFGVLQDTIGQKLFENLPKLQTARQNRQRKYSIIFLVVICYSAFAGNHVPLSPQSSLADG